MGISSRAKPQQAICHGSWCSALRRGGRNALLFFKILFPFTSDLNSPSIIHSRKGQLNTCYTLGINGPFLSQDDSEKQKWEYVFD